MKGMRIERLTPTTGLALMVALLWAGPVAADKATSGKPSDCETSQPAKTPDPARLASTNAPEDEPRPVYQPPRRGAPRAKVSGAMRGAPGLPTPLALAPNHVALTRGSQPSLFWHIDGVPDRRSRLVFTLVDENSIDPLVELDLDRPREAGIHRIRLEDHGVRLQPGAEYEWSVTLVVDPTQRSSDLISSGSIRRLASGEPCDGPWYDTLETLIDALEKSPRNHALHGQRVALLEQAGLDPALASSLR